MKTWKVTFSIFTFSLFILGIGPADSATVNYGNFTLDPGFVATNWSDTWDLTKGDLLLSYTIDMSSITQTAPGVTSYTEVGIRQKGSANFNPGAWNTYQGSAGGWMTSLVGNLTPTPNNLSNMDKHNLSASGGRGEGDYDVLTPNIVEAPPFGNFDNHGIWFDRDGLDPFQPFLWGAIDGGTYNTGGIYDIAITYHAINAGLGTMLATVNGVPTGFYIGGWKNAQPEKYPAGLSFKGDMTQMQVFAGLWAMDGAGGPVDLKDIRVTGHPVPEPTVLILMGCGLLGLVGMRRNFA